MSSQFGAFLAGVNLVLKALTGGKVLLVDPFDQLLLKTHNSALPGNVTLKSLEPIVTADATATTIVSIPVALNQVIGGEVIIVGKKTGSTDAYVGRTLFSGVNNAGTTAALATASNTALENSSGTPAITAVANDTTDAIDIKVAGIAAEGWTWSGYYHYQALTVA